MGETTFFYHYFQKIIPNDGDWKETKISDRKTKTICLPEFSSLFVSLFQTPSFLYFCGSLIRYLHICRYLKRLSCADLGYGTCAAFPVSGDHKKKKEERKKGKKNRWICDPPSVHELMSLALWIGTLHIILLNWMPNKEKNED